MNLSGSVFAIWDGLEIKYSAAVLVLELKNYITKKILEQLHITFFKQRKLNQYLALPLVPSLLVPRPGKTNRIS